MSYTGLKLIALASMLWDHLRASFGNSVLLLLWDTFCPQAISLPPALHALDMALAYLGRIAAPVFLWSVAQGFRYTHSRRKYALRLLLAALISQYPYLLANRVWSGGLLTSYEIGGCILFTQLAGLLTLCLFTRCRSRHPALGWAVAAAAVLLGEFFPIEGGGRYLLFLLVFYLTPHWPVPRRTLLWIILLPLSRYRLTGMLLTQFSPRMLALWCLNAMGPFLGVALTFLYNGKPGRAVPKWLWYIAYPLHLFLLGLAG